MNIYFSARDCRPHTAHPQRRISVSQPAPSPVRWMAMLLMFVTLASVGSRPPHGGAQDRPSPQTLDLPPALVKLLQHRCGPCHQGDEPAAGLDVTSLPGPLYSSGNPSAAFDLKSKAYRCIFLEIRTFQDELYIWWTNFLTFQLFFLK